MIRLPEKEWELVVSDQEAFLQDPYQVDSAVVLCYLAVTRKEDQAFLGHFPES